MVPPPLLRLARPAFWGAVAFALVMAWLPKPPRLPTGLWGDKVEHIIAFVILAVLAAVAYRTLSRVWIAAWLSLLGLVIELGQLVPRLNRDADVRDWLADSAAVVVVLALVVLVERRRPAPAVAD